MIIGHDGNAYIYYGCTSPSSKSCTEASRVTLTGPSTVDSYFGSSVSISGSTVIVGSWNNDAYIYYGCTSASSTTCTDANRVTLTGPPFFGYSVSVSGSTVVVGAHGTNSNQGSTYIYYGCTSAASTTCNDANGVTLTGPSAGSLFGISLSVSGSTVIIGAPLANNNQGGAYIYYGCTSISSTTCNDANRVNLGSIAAGYMVELSVSISGSTAVVGVYGEVYVYYGCTSASSTTCNDNNRVILKGPSGNISEYGIPAIISGSTVVVGAPDTNSYQGSVYMYYGCTSTSSMTCNDANRVTLSGPSPNGKFGMKLSISGDRVIVGASNNVYMYFATNQSTGMIKCITFLFLCSNNRFLG